MDLDAISPTGAATIGSSLGAPAASWPFVHGTSHARLARSSATRRKCDASSRARAARTGRVVALAGGSRSRPSVRLHAGAPEVRLQPRRHVHRRGLGQGEEEEERVARGRGVEHDERDGGFRHGPGEVAIASSENATLV